MDCLLFCVNHPEKIAKRHCNKCDQDLCNECVFDSHIEHHEEIAKIEYSIDIKKDNFSKILSKEIESIIEKSLNDLKPEIKKLVLEKTEEYIKDHKNLHLKLNNIHEKKPVNLPKKEEKTKPLNKQKESKESLKGNIETARFSSKSNIKERAQMFTLPAKAPPKIIDKNNPFGKKESAGGVKNMAKLFEQQ
jgi:hypothetical protein